MRVDMSGGTRISVAYKEAETLPGATRRRVKQDENHD